MIEWVLLGAGLVGVPLFLTGIKIVRPTERGLVERLGKYTRTAQPGFQYLFPVIYRMIKVDITENMVDVEPQKIITKDDLNAEVDAVVYFRVNNPPKSIYNAQDYKKQISSLARTTLRQIIGTMSLSDANSKREHINTIIEKELDKQTDAWGIEIVRVELQRIDPPEDVQESMNKVVIAERDKKAAVDFATAEETRADGEKRAAIKVAEGSKQSAILQADGQAQAIVKVADAQAKEIEVINQSLQKNFRNAAVEYKKLETAQNSLQHGTKYVIEPKTGITNVISSVAGITPIPLLEKKIKKPAKKIKMKDGKDVIVT